MLLLQDPAVPVKPVKLQTGLTMEQSVVAVPLPEKEIFVAEFEKFVIKSIYTCPICALVIFAVSEAAVEKLQSTTVFRFEPVVAVPKLLQ